MSWYLILRQEKIKKTGMETISQLKSCRGVIKNKNTEAERDLYNSIVAKKDEESIENLEIAMGIIKK